MLIRFPRDDKNFSWTRHIKNKMLFYNLSESRIKAILKNPARKQEGVATETVAVMRRNDRGKKKEEIWAMYKKNSNLKSRISKILMISAWRYPGVSKPGAEIPMPEDIYKELSEITWLR